MARFNRFVCSQTAACIVLLLPSLLRADGVMLPRTGAAADLAQTRQEALLAVHPDGNKVTYVLRSLYNGRASEFAWVLPVPATPTGVVAHQNSNLFIELDQGTRPTFVIEPASSGGSRGIGCGCAAPTGLNGAGGILLVEASGKAGVYDWAALTSTGSDALLTWLNTNGFDVPAAAAPVLDAYIGQNMHFLAVRVRETAAPTSGKSLEITPVQFTVETSRRFYPMAISQISAAGETEVILYLLAAHREEGANVANGLIDGKSLVPDFASESGTNYERLFTQKITDLGGLALITEFASPGANDWFSWPEIPSDFTSKPRFLTRMRTLISRDRMTQDFEFRDAADDTGVSPSFIVTEPGQANATIGQALGALAMVGLFCGLSRWSHRRPAAGRVCSSRS